MKQKQKVWMAGILLVLLIVAWIGESRAQDSPAHSTPIWFGTEVSIAPDPDAAGMVRLSAE